MMAIAMRGWFLLSLQLVFSLAFAERSKTWSRGWIIRGGAALDDDLPEPVPAVELPPVWASPKRGIIFMDKFTPYFGYYMSQRAREAYGVACINVMSSYMIGYFLKEHAGLMEPLSMAMPSQEQVNEWKAQIPVDEIVGIICESDSGLADAERLGVLLGLQNHDGVNEARRNKYLMIEQVGKAGLSVVQQKLCYSSEEAVEFAKKLGIVEQEEVERNVPGSTMHTLDDNVGNDDNEAYNTGSLGKATNVHHHSTEMRMCIVKPVRGAATDSVFLCKNQIDVKNAFNVIKGMPIFDDPRRMHESVLIQEFAAGTEYAIDIVSKDGEHKVAALWRYDKRPANGASFVYFATEVIDADTEVGKLVCEYVKNALDALDIKWGQTHSEVILGKEPRLVEVNCRQHNMDFAPLTMACIGYNSLDMTLAAYLGGNNEDTYPPDTKDLRLDWESLPDLSVTRAYGAVVHLVNYADGILLSVNEEALQEIQAMESVFDMEIYPSFLEIGAPLLPTIDIRTDAGWVQIINDDREAFRRDYERIVELMPELFIVDPR